MTNQKKIKVFLVDDDPIFQKVLETQFKERTPHEIKTFSTGEDCLKKLNEKPDIIFLDYQLNSLSPKAQTGLQILNKIKAIDPEIEVVMLSSQDHIEVAVNCMKHDAFDYIVKSESAFMRAQKTISEILKIKKIKKEVVFYRTSSILLCFAVVITITIVVVIQIYYPSLLK